MALKTLLKWLNSFTDKHLHLISNLKLSAFDVQLLHHTEHTVLVHPTCCSV